MLREYWEYLTCSDGRHGYIDGLRGYASVVVMLMHFCLYSNNWDAIRMAGTFLNGSFAVRVFFALSGFSLACGRSERSMVRTLIARWPRLAIPCLFHGLVECATSRMLGHHVAVSLLGNSLLLFCPPHVNAVFERYVVGDGITPPLEALYNESLKMYGHLWTMPAELSGSVLVLLYGLAEPHLREGCPWWTLCPPLVIALFIAPSMFFFALGLIFQRKWPANPEEDARLACTAATVAVLGLDYIPRIPLMAWHIVTALRVTLCLFVVMRSPASRRLLSARPSILLGRISFSLYLCHTYIFKAVSLFAPNHSLAFGLSVPTALIWATITTPVDRLATVKSRRFAENFLAADKVADGGGSMSSDGTPELNSVTTADGRR